MPFAQLRSSEKRKKIYRPTSVFIARRIDVIWKLRHIVVSSTCSRLFLERTRDQVAARISKRSVGARILRPRWFRRLQHPVVVAVCCAARNPKDWNFYAAAAVCEITTPARRKTVPELPSIKVVRAQTQPRMYLTSKINHLQRILCIVTLSHVKKLIFRSRSTAYG